MQNDDTKDDLSTMFRNEEAAFDDDQFVREVMRPIQRSRFERRAILSIAGLLGGAVGGAQLPALSRMVDITGENISSTLLAFQGFAVVTQGSSILWLAMIGAAAVCTAMVAVIERA